MSLEQVVQNLENLDQQVEATPEQQPQEDERFKILADKEAQLQQKQREYQEQVKKDREALTVDRELLSKIENAKQIASIDPLAYLEQLGVENWYELAEAAYVKGMGDKAPSDMVQRVQNRMAMAQAKMAQYEVAQLKAPKEQPVEQQSPDPVVVQEYIGSLDSAAKSLDIAKYPILTTEYKENPQATVEALFKYAEKLYEQTGEVPEASKVAEALEQAVYQHYERLSSIIKQPPSKQPVVPTKQKLQAKPSAPQVDSSETDKLQRAIQAATLEMAKRGS